MQSSASFAAHSGLQVREPWVLVEREELGHAYRSRYGHARQVVADQVGNHDVLRLVLWEHRLARRCGALDGATRDGVAIDTQVALGARRNYPSPRHGARRRYGYPRRVPGGIPCSQTL